MCYSTTVSWLRLFGLLFSHSHCLPIVDDMEMLILAPPIDYSYEVILEVEVRAVVQRPRILGVEER